MFYKKIVLYSNYNKITTNSIQIYLLQTKDTKHAAHN